MYRRLFAAGLAVAVASLAGCGGSGLVPAEGVVTLDGVPVDKATVVFVSEDGGKTYSAQSDSSGAFALGTGKEKGAAPGKYKVMVTKTAGVAGDQVIDPSSGENNKAYFDIMQKQKDEAKAAMKGAKGSGGKGAGMMPPGGGMMPPGGGMMPPGGGMPGGGGAPGTAPPTKTELPQKYATAEGSGLTATVESGGSKSIKIELSSAKK